MHYVTPPIKKIYLTPTKYPHKKNGRKFLWGTDNKVYKNTVQNWHYPPICVSNKINSVLLLHLLLYCDYKDNKDIESKEVGSLTLCSYSNQDSYCLRELFNPLKYITINNYLAMKVRVSIQYNFILVTSFKERIKSINFPLYIHYYNPYFLSHKIFSEIYLCRKADYIVTVSLLKCFKH